MITIVLFQSVYAISEAKSLDDVIKNGIKLIQIFGLAVKFIIYWIKQNEIRSLVGKINKMVLKKINTAAIRHFQKLDYYINRCLRCYFGVGFFAYFSTVIIKPFVHLIYTYHIRKEWDFAPSLPHV
jgi:hypothetical protein